MREAIRKAVPGAEEVISYPIPAFKKDGGWILYYSMYTAHYSLACPPPFAAFKVFAKELAEYKRSKSAVNFPLDEPVPVKLIGKMAKFQAQEWAARAGNRAKTKSKTKSKTKAKPMAKAKPAKKR